MKAQCDTLLLAAKVSEIHVCGGGSGISGGGTEGNLSGMGWQTIDQGALQSTAGGSAAIHEPDVP